MRRFSSALIGSLFAWMLCACPAADDSDGPGGDEVGSEDSETETESESGTETGTETETETESEGESDTGMGGNPLLSDAVLNIAHRGGRRERPEATLPAFEHALSVGSDVIEMDLHMSSDGVIVVLHDDTVDRTTDGTGPVKDMSFDELRALDAGYDFTTDDGETFPYRGMGIQIPRVEEIFETFPDAYYLMEIKQTEPSLVPTFAAVLEDYGIADRIVVASFSDATIQEFREASPDTFTAMALAEMLAYQQASNDRDPDYVPPCEFVQSPWELTSKALIDFAHALDLKVHPWTVNDAADMENLIADGVDGIMTDDPVLLEGVIGG
ncbi:glycerophosphoryl diester phosphodiesterase [Plesiocystis pacifica SIR-1]|uniref:Glycerophosphoryl diester phosphodiesterase n=1 Tax=Plesiocystis pacifica SIR-1 TaxID=391625 RepID=A6G0N0_9BACT|nr:glycerophosphodiester phosphodiesterase [Plesiocystis pacifica]EDM80676.1 glycerophosphoryl diester phosphodiesterase [Plesiocystis pacifica SIR-1]